MSVAICDFRRVTVSFVTARLRRVIGHIPSRIEFFVQSYILWRMMMVLRVHDTRLKNQQRQCQGIPSEGHANPPLLELSHRRGYAQLVKSSLLNPGQLLWFLCLETDKRRPSNVVCGF